MTLRGQNADRDEGRLRSGLRQAAAQRRLQEGPVRQPARAAAGLEKSDDPAERRAERAGDDHRERPASQDHQARGGDQQLVNKSASADARSLKILLDLMLNLEARARASAAPAPAVGPGDEEVLAQLKARLEGAIRDQMATKK